MSGLTLASNSAAFEQRIRRVLAGSLNGDLRRWKGDLSNADLRMVIAELTADGGSLEEVFTRVLTRDEADPAGEAT